MLRNRNVRICDSFGIVECRKRHENMLFHSLILFAFAFLFTMASQLATNHTTTILDVSLFCVVPFGIYNISEPAIFYAW